MGRRSSTGGVEPHGDRIQVTFTWQGRRLRPTLALRPTEPNLRAARRLRADILAEIRLGTFNLERHFPDYRFAEKHVPDGRRTFGQWAKAWEKTAGRGRAHSTFEVYKDHLACYWTSAWKNKPALAITEEDVLTRLADLASGERPIGEKTQNNILIPLRGVFEMVCKAHREHPNPVEGIKNLRFQAAEPDPYPLPEVERLLKWLEKFNPAWADFFEFACFAGLRPGEQIGMLWPDVSFDDRLVTVQRARVLRQDKDRTKTNTRRIVELNARTFKALNRQRARTQLAGRHVWVHPSTGIRFNDGREIAAVWARANKATGLRYRPPKECRDTSISLALAAGCDPAWVAAQHGHSVQVMMKSYAKYIPKADRGRNLKAVDRLVANPVANRSKRVSGTKPEDGT